LTYVSPRLRQILNVAAFQLKAPPYSFRHSIFSTLPVSLDGSDCGHRNT